MLYFINFNFKMDVSKSCAKIFILYLLEKIAQMHSMPFNQV